MDGASQDAFATTVDDADGVFFEPSIGFEKEAQLVQSFPARLAVQVEGGSVTVQISGEQFLGDVSPLTVDILLFHGSSTLEQKWLGVKPGCVRRNVLALLYMFTRATVRRAVLYGTIGLAAAIVVVSVQYFERPRPSDIVRTVHQAQTDRVDETGPFSSSSSIPTNGTVVRVIDGDTFVTTLDGQAGRFTIRLLGINTPETVDPRKPVECFGHEASARGKELLVPGTRVRLDPDPQADEVDIYGRLLRVVYLPDGRQYNQLMVEEGYAHAMVDFPMKAAYKHSILLAESQARSAERGLWSPATCNGIK